MRYKASSKIKSRNNTKRHIGNFLKITVAAVFVLGPIFILRADFLQIKEVAVVGAENSHEQNIKEKIMAAASGNKFILIPKSNILLLDKEGLAAALLSEFPSLEMVNINKKINKTLEVEVKERVPEFLWCVLDDCFNMDRSGLVFERSLRASDKVVFSGVLAGNPIMKSFTDAEGMQNFMKAIENFKNAKIHVSSVNVELADKAVFSTNLGNIILNPEEDISISSANVVLLANDLRIKNPSLHFEYADARFGNKIFYK